VWLDVAEFVTVAVAAQADPLEILTEDGLDRLVAAEHLYRGHLLEGCDDDWCLVERTHLEDLHLTLLEQVSAAHEQRGQPAAAIRWAQRLLEVEPAHERSHRRLMRLYYQVDDRTRALRQYQRCRWVLEQELGVRPSRRTEDVAAAISADALPVPAWSPAPPVPLQGPAVDWPTDPDLSPLRLLDAFRAELAALRASVDAIKEQLTPPGMRRG
jgi:DNA-binding SARP family transcriptional activator